MKLLHQIFWPVFDALAAVLFPSTCKICRNSVDQVTLGVICRECWQAITPVQSPYCSRCGYEFPSKIVDPVDALCGSCRRDLHTFDFARAWSSFKTPLKEIIHEFKYQAHFSLARPLAAQLAATYDVHRGVLQADLIIPVPLHKVRERERGFNQASELAKHLGKTLDLEVRQAWLLRVRPTKVQAGLSRRERRLNMKDAFKVAGKARLQGTTVLLVDDVFTTGATLNECVKILKRAGVRRVNCLTVARVVRE